jgi:hypothetical protein
MKWKAYICIWSHPLVLGDTRNMWSSTISYLYHTEYDRYHWRFYWKKYLSRWLSSGLLRLVVWSLPTQLSPLYYCCCAVLLYVWRIDARERQLSLSFLASQFLLPHWSEKLCEKTAPSVYILVSLYSINRNVWDNFREGIRGTRKAEKNALR